MQKRLVRELGLRVYRLQRSGKSSREFIKRFIEKLGRKVTGVLPVEIEIPRRFKFHTKRNHRFETILCQMEGKRHG